MTSAKKGWSYSAGEWGRNRVRAYEDPKSGLLLVEFYERPRNYSKPLRRRISLGHRDRLKAKQQADKIAVAIGHARSVLVSTAALAELFDIYVREVTPTKSERSRKHDRQCADMFLRFFGRQPDAVALNLRDWDRFIQERRSGRIRPAGRHTSTGVRNRTIARDLKWLLAVLNWATRAGDGQGGVLLERNPLKGLPLPKEASPRRPVITHERYETMREVASIMDWRFRVALVLAHESGHRIGAIRHLKWSDIDLEAGRVRWRGEMDKNRFEHVTPLTEPMCSALEEARRRNPAIGDAWVLPAPKYPSKPISRHLVRDWWYQAEERASLEHVPGLGWHGLRRKFATELKDVPLKDLCTLGGWKSPATILTCYQQADEDTMRRALESRRPVGRTAEA